MGWNLEQHQAAARALEPSNDRLLTAFLGGEPLPTIASSLEISLSTLLERLTTPAFRELLATVARLQRTQQRLCSFAAPAIHALSTICTETPNLNHRRLAASQILRFAQSLNRPPKRTPRTTREPQHPAREIPSSAAGSSESRPRAQNVQSAALRTPTAFPAATIQPQESVPSLIRESPASSLMSLAGSAPHRSNSGILATCLPTPTRQARHPTSRHSTPKLSMHGSSRTTAPP